MKLTEERKTYLIGALLAGVLLCQIIESFVGGKQQAAYNRINWLIGHSNKSLTLLNNFANLFILDKENTSRNFENYRKGFNRTRQQHQQMSIEEVQLLKDIDHWGQVEKTVSMIGLFFTVIVMMLYSNLVLEISKRLNKSL